MILEQPTNPDVSAIAAITDRTNGSKELRCVLRLIESISKENKKSHMDQLTIRLNPEVLKLFKEMSRQTDQSIAQIIRACLLHAIQSELQGRQQEAGNEASKGNQQC